MLTEEQTNIIEAVKKYDLIKVKAVAGSGKTFTLSEIVKELKPTSGIYMAYNKKIAEEAKERFPSCITCKTIHALAFKYVAYSIGSLNYNTIKENISNYDKKTIIDELESFFNSKSIDAYEYLDEGLSPKHRDIALDILNDMYNCNIEASFGFVLKMFHIALYQKDISINIDILLLDESGDTTECILEIFKLINAKKKVAVGDSYQNIYGFNNTIDGFEALKDKGIELSLTNSFRCTPEIGNKVEKYCKKYIDKDFKYNGVLEPKDIKTICYISRNNATVIRRMLNYMHRGTRFKLVRDPYEIFSLPLAIYNIARDNLKYVDINRYMYIIKAKKERPSNVSLYDYLLQKFYHDIQIKGACKLLKDLQKKGIDLLSSYYNIRNL